MPDPSPRPLHRALQRRLRQAVLLLVSIASMAGAGAALWAWISPETIQATGTASLFALLALLFLPVATLAAMEADRRRSGERRFVLAAQARAESDTVAPAQIAAPAPVGPAKVLHHNPAISDRVTTSRRRRARQAPEYSPAALPH